MSFHATRHVDVDGRFQAKCTVCGWTGQAWETAIGAENEAEFHRAHPDLSGEHPVIEENEQ